ncbi:glutathionylspermidine synthase family protein [Robertmurraya yapensis]|uniref:Glutathionylspermidine synthase family protein n=1 Tax=Bacillus yapensis TaxID=2492960 RepID=A0A3S0KKS0_9BACI|nr:glutathionylspermidine synthase family protein [Bacillus yapensis]RTR33135.1 glutathionylspermidine synthase family protein [Bacillus yapensis]TKS96958.1 glutathionylspermidine synthase family protein [Bacillus yapensis]
MKRQANYHTKREQFYGNIEGFWADLYGEEYALYDIKLLNQNEVDQIRLISERIGSIFFKTASLLRKVPDETLLEMGFPKETLAFIRLKTLPAESVISRLDLIPYGDSYKCIEINADTPTFIKELFHINGMVCKEFGVENPNEGMEELLRKAVLASVSYGTNSPHIVFTAHEDNIEDRETVLYLQSAVPSKFTPLHKLQIRRGVGLFDDDGIKIDILYRQTFPIESLIKDEDEEGNPIGLWLMELIEEGKLVVINPPSAFLLQNKAVQAIIWGLHEEHHSFFTEEEHTWIDEYFLPTYLEADYFIEKGIPFVKKPSFGREGDTVEIFNKDGQLLHADVQRSYSEFVPVYQQFVEHPTVAFHSEKGTQDGKLLIGSFLLNGKSAAFGLRVGGTITNNLSYFLPVGLLKERG